jgi:hypothetical protein
VTKKPSPAVIAFDSLVGGQLSANAFVMVPEQPFPRGVADLGRFLGRADDVGE